MRVLAIETSCDETAVAVLECTGDTSGAAFTILGNALYSQIPDHAPYGGVYPMLAKREHQKNLPRLLEQAFREAGGAAVDLVTVTHGPGLEPALWAGITFAEELGKKWKMPVIGVDHMEGHIVSALLKQVTADSFQLSGRPPLKAISYKLEAIKLPLLALLVSGGHTELILMKKWFEYELVGATRDDAVGEAFDKVARLLDLPYPGGPKLAELAARGRAKGGNTITFPRPMANDDTCDFSFAGLKTAVLYKLRSMDKLSESDKEHIAEAFEDAARDVITIKTRRALQKTSPASLIAAGGVSANIEMRNALAKLVEEEFPAVALSFPHDSLTGDNAVMVGAAGYLRKTAGLGAADGPIIARGKQHLEKEPRTTKGARRTRSQRGRTSA
jgi:N6-L-threonylcarbamoyladenine synthase